MDDLISAHTILYLSCNSETRNNAFRMYGNLVSTGKIKPVNSLNEHSSNSAYKAYSSHFLNQQDAITVVLHCYTSVDLVKFLFTFI